MTKLGEVWPVGVYIHVRDKTNKRWFLTIGEPINEDGSSHRREEDELSESEANEMGIFRVNKGENV